MKVRYGANMRVLIVGGGIAGLALAALLEQRGGSPDVIEKAHHYGGVGYVLGLWPAGGNVLKGLGLFEASAGRSIPLTAYRAFDNRDSSIVDFRFTGVDPRVDDARLINRAELLEVLRGALHNAVRFNTTIETLSEDSEGVHVQFSDGTCSTYDCVVGADGMHSRVRELLFGRVALRYSGLSGWAFWTAPGSLDMREYYGDGRFAGFYPACDVLCCFAVVAGHPGCAGGVQSLPDLRAKFAGMSPTVLQAFDAADSAQPVWSDDFYDVNTPFWSKGRVALLGDAAVTILPTAGVGASMALESAAVLAQELSLSDSRLLSYALARYHARRRSRVEALQSQSRALTWLIRARGPFSVARNLLFRRMPRRMFIKAFSNVLSSSL